MSFPVQEALFERGPGDGTTVAFQFSKFSVDLPDEVGVALIDQATEVKTILTYPTDFSVALDPLGHGIVTFNTAPADDQDYFLFSNIPYASLLTLGVRGNFDEIAMTNAINRTAKQLQQMANAIERNIQIPQDAGVSAQLVTAELQPGYALVVSDDGTRLTTAPVSTASMAGQVALAVAAREGAELAQTAAETSETNAGLSEAAAEGFKDDAETAKIAAEAAAATFTKASQAEAEAGTDNTKYMSSLRVAQAIDAQVTPPAGLFTYRTPNSSADFSTFTLDNSWRDLDISSIVPSGATAVAIAIACSSSSVNAGFRVRRKGGSSLGDVQCRVKDTTTDTDFEQGICGVDSNRYIQYLGNSDTAEIYIIGWFK